MNTTNEIWDKLVQSYDYDTKVKNLKLQTYRIKYETQIMHVDESIARFFLRVDDIVKSMRNIGYKISDTIVFENILRSLTPKSDSKVSAIE